MVNTRKKKVIWLVNKHAAPIEYNATNLRTYKLASYFNKMGYDARIICSGFVHNRNINLLDKGKKYDEKEYAGVKFIFIKTLSYGENGFKRILSIIMFSLRLFRIKKKLIVPDIIIHSPCIPFDYLLSRCAKILHAKYIVEIMDLWPESFVAFGLIKKTNPLLPFMYFLERKIYEKCDNLIFSMEGGKAYIKDKKWDLSHGGNIDLNKIYYLNNGVDIDDFDRNQQLYVLDDKELTDPSLKRIIYLGSIRLANHLQTLIEAAEYFISRKDVVFLIYGDGEDRERLEAYVNDRHLNNVIFKQKWIDLKYVPYVLSRAYLHILNYKPNAIERYGGSQNKLFQSMASGKPIMSNVGMGYSLINKYNLGVDKKFKNTQDYVDSLNTLLNLNKEEYEQMCARARNVSLKFDLQKLAIFYANNIL